ncbi:MAG: DUF3127 domain-containing protein [Spartobacteria bacterium]|nr:DUF3127 domain-containing protein [Spartobacteria bacterium]
MGSYDLTGKVKVVMDTQTFDSGFKKREFVVTMEDSRYPQDICFETLAEKISILDNIKPDQEVKVSFDIRGREYNGRYFNNLSAWKIEVLSQAPAADESSPVENIPAELEPDTEDPPF